MELLGSRQKEFRKILFAGGGGSYYNMAVQSYFV
jgi:hypothetical protein